MRPGPTTGITTWTTCPSFITRDIQGNLARCRTHLLPDPARHGSAPGVDDAQFRLDRRRRSTTWRRVASPRESIAPNPGHRICQSRRVETRQPLLIITWDEDSGIGSARRSDLRHAPGRIPGRKSRIRVIRSLHPLRPASNHRSRPGSPAEPDPKRRVRAPVNDLFEIAHDRSPDPSAACPKAAPRPSATWPPGKPRSPHVWCSRADHRDSANRASVIHGTLRRDSWPGCWSTQRPAPSAVDRLKEDLWNWHPTRQRRLHAQESCVIATAPPSARQAGKPEHRLPPPT